MASLRIHLTTTGSIDLGDAGEGPEREAVIAKMTAILSGEPSGVLDFQHVDGRMILIPIRSILFIEILPENVPD